MVRGCRIAGLYGPHLWGCENRGGPAKAAAAINEWHGPACSILSVAAGRVYFHSGNQIVCLAPKN